MNKNRKVIGFVLIVVASSLLGYAVFASISQQSQPVTIPGVKGVTFAKCASPANVTNPQVSASAPYSGIIQYGCSGVQAFSTTATGSFTPSWRFQDTGDVNGTAMAIQSLGGMCGQPNPPRIIQNNTAIVLPTGDWTYCVSYEAGSLGGTLGFVIDWAP